MSSLSPCRMPQTLAPVWELQSECQSVSAWLPAASQRGERRHVAVADRAPQRVEAQAVDLQEQHARRPVVRCRCAAGAAGGAAEEQLVLVEASRLLTSAPTADIATATTTAVPRPAITTPGHHEGDRQQPRRPSSRNAADAEREHRDRQRDPQRPAATPPRTSSPNSSATTVGCHHCGIAKPASQRVEQEQRARRTAARPAAAGRRPGRRAPSVPLRGRTTCLIGGRRGPPSSAPARPRADTTRDQQHQHGGDQGGAAPGRVEQAAADHAEHRVGDAHSRQAARGGGQQPAPRVVERARGEQHRDPPGGQQPCR